jgi:acetyl-CoA carboxylase biotin carboxylase subunit
MLEVAAGTPLPFTQAEIARRGVALQCRICAENPRNDFAPSAGRVFIHREPSGPSVRVDSGVSNGQVVSTFYDSLLGKLCVWAPTRQRALATMTRALSEYSISGLATNLEFHAGALRTEAFQTGSYDTRFVPDHRQLLEPPLVEGHALAAAVLSRHLTELPRQQLKDVPLSRWAASARPGWTGSSR